MLSSLSDPPPIRNVDWRTHAPCEELEPRLLFADIVVNGTNSFDTIVVTRGDFNTVAVTVNGSTTNYTDAQVTTISILTLDGNDNITINGAADPITIQAGNHDDTIIIGAAANDISNINQTIDVRGQSNTDTLDVRDGARLANDTYTLARDGFGRDTIGRTGVSTIIYSGIDNVRLKCGNMNNPIVVEETDYDTAYDILAGAGNDTFDIFGPGAHRITCNGEDGVETMTIDDTASALSGAANISSINVMIPGPDDGGMPAIHRFSFPFVETVELNLGTGNTAVAFGGGSIQGLPAFAIDGGTGSDSVAVDDSTNGFNDAYSHQSSPMGGMALARAGFGGLRYNNLDAFSLLTGNGRDSITVRDSAAGTPVTVDGGVNNDTVFIGGGNLDSCDGALTAQGGAGTDTLNIEDASGGTVNYDLTATTLTRAGFAGLTFSGFEGTFLNASGNANTVNLAGVANGNPFTVRAGAGADTINVGAGGGFGLFNVRAAVTVDGGSQPAGSTDALNILDVISGGGDTYIINGSHVARVGFAGLDSSFVEAVTLNAEGGNNVINVNEVPADVPLTINAGDGNDTINLGGAVVAGGNLDLLRARVTAHGQAGTNSLLVNDSTNVLTDTLSLTSIQLTRPRFGGLSYDGFTSVAMWAGPGTQTLNISAENIPVTLRTGGGGDTVNVESDAFSVNVTFDQPETLASLFVGGNDRAILARSATNGGKLLSTRALTMSVSGRLDLENNNFILDYPVAGPSPVASVHALLASGYNGGAWNGLGGILSTAAATTPRRALGMVDTAAFAVPSFGGASPDRSAILIGYTVPGDCNLDLRVDVSDLGILSSNYGVSGRYWYQANFNYDNLTDVSDLGILSTNYGQQLPAGPTLRRSLRQPVLVV